ncbi:MAG TPA: hypothetical protein VLI04_21340 [Nocardioidaceae bacterium]|nr:hypothetical protein [Nocardioidaceae bacterium]
MTTLHIENTVKDFDSWKAAFDKFERFRQDHGVRSYRVSRYVGDDQAVNVDLDFDSVEDATAFRTELEKIWRTPQSQEQLIEHGTPQLLEVVVSRTF